MSDIRMIERDHSIYSNWTLLSPNQPRTRQLSVMTLISDCNVWMANWMNICGTQPTTLWRGLRHDTWNYVHFSSATQCSTDTQLSIWYSMFTSMLKGHMLHIIIHPYHHSSCRRKHSPCWFIILLQPTSSARDHPHSINHTGSQWYTWFTDKVIDTLWSCRHISLTFYDSSDLIWLRF